MFLYRNYSTLPAPARQSPIRAQSKNVNLSAQRSPRARHPFIFPTTAAALIPITSFFFIPKDLD